MFDPRSVVVSTFRLDGGAMFGSVPRALWERQRAPDERHRIPLVARVLLLSAPGLRILIDAGLGDKFSAREREIFGVSSVSADEESVPWDELTHLLPTHLHFDHAGGLTKWSPGFEPAEVPPGSSERGRRAKLRAPQARFLLQRANWERARAPGPRERASYLRENVVPLERADLELLGGDGEVLPGIRVHVSNGHTRGLQWVTIETNGGTVAFPSDLVPTESHLHLPYTMGYDMCVETLLAEKESFLRRAVDESWIVVFAHDPDIAAARLERGATGRFQVAERVSI